MRTEYGLTQLISRKPQITLINMADIVMQKKAHLNGLNSGHKN